MPLPPTFSPGARSTSRASGLCSSWRSLCPWRSVLGPGCWAGRAGSSTCCRRKTSRGNRWEPMGKGELWWIHHGRSRMFTRIWREWKVCQDVGKIWKNAEVRTAVAEVRTAAAEVDWFDGLKMGCPYNFIAATGGKWMNMDPITDPINQWITNWLKAVAGKNYRKSWNTFIIFYVISYYKYMWCMRLKASSNMSLQSIEVPLFSDIFWHILADFGITLPGHHVALDHGHGCPQPLTASVCQRWQPGSEKWKTHRLEAPGQNAPWHRKLGWRDGLAWKKDTELIPGLLIIFGDGFKIWYPNEFTSITSLFIIRRAGEEPNWSRCWRSQEPAMHLRRWWICSWAAGVSPWEMGEVPCERTGTAWDCGFEDASGIYFIISYHFIYVHMYGNTVYSGIIQYLVDVSLRKCHNQRWPRRQNPDHWHQEHPKTWTVLSIFVTGAMIHHGCWGWLMAVAASCFDGLSKPKWNADWVPHVLSQWWNKLKTPWNGICNLLPTGILAIISNVSDQVTNDNEMWIIVNSCFVFSKCSVVFQSKNRLSLPSPGELPLPDHGPIFSADRDGAKDAPVPWHGFKPCNGCWLARGVIL